jgi:flagellum-specific peptidoglycan hydrolase FlgJ
MALKQSRIDFIKKHGGDVILATRGTNIFPSVKMAQMILESADSKGNEGKGITAVKAKNYFGIKAQKGYTGKKMAFNTPKDGQPVNYFRVYDSVQDSIADHTKFLQVNQRYTKGGVFTATTPEAQALALQKSGYAEGNDGKGGGYAQSLINLIKNYNLKELDKELNTGITTPRTGKNEILPLFFGLGVCGLLAYLVNK